MGMSVDHHENSGYMKSNEIFKKMYFMERAVMLAVIKISDDVKDSYIANEMVKRDVQLMRLCARHEELRQQIIGRFREVNLTS